MHELFRRLRGNPLITFRELPCQHRVQPGGAEVDGEMLLLLRDGQVHVYYGAAHTSVCLATARPSDLVGLCRRCRRA